LTQLVYLVSTVSALLAKSTVWRGIRYRILANRKVAWDQYHVFASEDSSDHHSFLLIFNRLQMPLHL
ncbi:MAG: hypothetical protein AAGA30_03840, partial [Planctomycetota bacterium]